MPCNASQRLPRSDVVAQLLRGRLVGHDVDRVRDQEVAGADRVDVAIVLGHARANAFVLAEQAEQLQACVVDVVVLAATDEIRVDRCLGHGSGPSVQYRTPFV